MRPFRFAISATGPTSPERWSALARRAEELGYSALVMPDHLWKQFAPVPALAAAALATSRLRVGTLVFANDYRHPVMLAREAATLDVLSGGRLELGLGAGWKIDDYAQLGTAYDAPRVRIERLAEAVRLIKRLFTEDAVDFEGKHYRVRGARLGIRPTQRPHPPLLIAGGGRRILGLAAREADIVGVFLRLSERGIPPLGDLSAAAMERKVERVRSAAGARFEQLELNTLVVDVEVARRALALASIAARLKGALASIVDSPYFLYGSVEEIRETLLARRERFGISYYTVPVRAMEPLAPVVRELAGR